MAANSRDVGTGVVKMLWEGKRPGSFAEFEISCSSVLYPELRVMYLTTSTQHYGKALLHIDGVLVGTPSGYRPKSGTLFTHGNFPFPKKRAMNAVSSGKPKSSNRHIVRITVLNQTDEPPSKNKKVKKYGIGINALMCVVPKNVVSKEQAQGLR